MATVKELKAQAKEAGLTGYSSWNKDKLEAELAKAGAAPAPEKASKDKDPHRGQRAVGVPTEPEKANLSDTEKASLKVHAGGRSIEPASPKQGIPTEPERGGVTAKDLHVKDPKLAKDAHEPAEKAEPLPQPTITGNKGKPTEPDRGGLNKLERELAGVS